MSRVESAVEHLPVGLRHEDVREIRNLNLMMISLGVWCRDVERMFSTARSGCETTTAALLVAMSTRFL